MLEIAAVLNVIAAVSNLTVHNQGSVKTTEVNISIYEDSACTLPLTSIDWGTLEVGETRTYTAYVLNSGVTPVEVSMSTSNWNPAEAPNTINVTWDSENAVVNPEAVQQVAFSLTVTQEGVSTFEFDITILGKAP